MFEFLKEGTTLKFVLHYWIPYGSNWKSEFTNRYTDEHQAQLAYAHLRELFETEIKKIRQESYEQGWKDRGSKKLKQQYFSSKF